MWGCGGGCRLGRFRGCGFLVCKGLGVWGKSGRWAEIAAVGLCIRVRTLVHTLLLYSVVIFSTFNITYSGT